MTSGDIYIFSGLGGAGVDESDSFTNWTGTDSAVMGTTAIYVFALDLAGTSGGVAGNDLIKRRISPTSQTGRLPSVMAKTPGYALRQSVH